MKTFKYKWKIENKEIVGQHEFENRVQLEQHVKNIGGELIEILEEIEKRKPYVKSPNSYKWAKICSNMINLMDSGREQWFYTLIGWFKEYTIVDVVNNDLKSNINIGIREENIPGTFPFNNISGETIEATLMGW